MFFGSNVNLIASSADMIASAVAENVDHKTYRVAMTIVGETRSGTEMSEGRK